MDLHPTHTCFDDALDFIERRIREDIKKARELFLVHGILLAPTGEQKGTPYCHAWVEDPLGLAWQDGLLESGERVTYATPVETFRNVFRPQKETRYTLAEAAIENQRTGHYGPWLEEYQALCGSEVLGKVKIA